MSNSKEEKDNCVGVVRECFIALRRERWAEFGLTKKKGKNLGVHRDDEGRAEAGLWGTWSCSLW